MTAIRPGAAAPTTVPAGRHGSLLGDAWLLTGRLVKQVVRVPDVLVFTIVQPIMFIVLFRYVFGGAINVGGGSYVNFLMPGIFVQTLLFNGAVTGVGMAEDMQRGLIDRFRALPIARSALLLARALSDVMRSTLVFLIMLAVGIGVGFRFSGGVLGGIEGTLLMLGLSFAFSWIGILIGLSVKSVEAAQSGGFIWLFPLTFASSAFVRTDSMPAWLRAFANHNPVTVLVNSVRRLYLSHDAAQQFGVPALGGQLGQTLAWLVGLLLIFVLLSVRKFRRMSR